MKRSLLFIIVGLIFTHTQSQTWQALTSMPFSLSYPVVVVLKGDIHVIGGGATGGATDMHLRYKPSTGKWDTLAPVPYKAQQPAGAVVNGKIYFCGGGFPNTGTPLKKHFYFDPDSNKWFPAADMPVATAIHKAVSFDNKLYVLSGQPNKTLCEYYDPATNTWTQRNALPDANFWYGAIVTDNKAIYRFGGGGYTNPQKSVYQYDKLSDAWGALPDLPLGLHGADGAFINDSFIYITGGYNLGDKDRVWKFNTHSAKYVSTGVMPAARSYHNMVAIDSCIYSVGGNNNSVPSVATSLIRYCPQVNEAGIDVMIIENSKPYQLINNNGNMSVLFGESINDEKGQIDIVDLSGKIIFSENINSQQINFNTQSLNGSMYFIHIFYEGKRYMEKLVVVK